MMVVRSTETGHNSAEMAIGIGEGCVTAQRIIVGENRDERKGEQERNGKQCNSSSHRLPFQTKNITPS